MDDRGLPQFSQHGGPRPNQPPEDAVKMERPSSGSSLKPSYRRVALTFLRNSLVRDMTFRANFLIDTVSSLVWVLMNLGFYVLIFEYTPMIGAGTGWGKYQFFLFLGTTLIINSLTRGLFLSNAIELSEHIRNGTLDFILLKPIDTQFLVSLGRIEWSALGPLGFGVLLMGYSFSQLGYAPGPVTVVLYVFYVGCGCAIYYSLMIALSATAIWFGRNQSLLDFWFYITNFSRYPMEIYRGPWGDPLRWTFTFIIPVLVAVNIPARMLVRPLDMRTAADWTLPAFTVVATFVGLALSRWIFQRALLSYRSASS